MDKTKTDPSSEIPTPPQPDVAAAVDSIREVARLLPVARPSEWSLSLQKDYLLVVKTLLQLQERATKLQQKLQRRAKG